MKLIYKQETEIIPERKPSYRWATEEIKVNYEVNQQTMREAMDHFRRMMENLRNYNPYQGVQVRPEDYIQ